jgi:malonyl-CoA O-methyltransferase
MLVITGNEFDKRAVRRSFSRSAHHYDAVARLQKQVAAKLVQLLPFKSTDGLWLDLGAGTGFLLDAMQSDRFSGHMIAVDLALPMLQQSRCKSFDDRAVSWVCADIECLPFLPGQVDVVVSSLALQWCENFSQVFSGVKKVLKPGGVFGFATMGPGTLLELKQAWAEVDHFTHVSPFYDPEALLACLQSEGFTLASMKQEIRQLAYPSVMALMQELKQTGAHHMTWDRKRKLTTKQQLQNMMDAYPKQSQQGDIQASYDIIYVLAYA